MAIEMEREPSGETGRLSLQSVVTFRNNCPEAFIRQLRFDPGVGQFSDFNPTLDRARLIETAQQPEGSVTLAYTDEGVIVGYVPVAPPDPRDRWGNIKGVYEARAIDVSRNYRGWGIGKQLLRQAFADHIWDRRIVFATAYAWHWDLVGTGLTKEAYGRMLRETVRPAGFIPFETDEPNIRWDEANMLLVRVGAEVDEALYYSFHARLFEYRF